MTTVVESKRISPVMRKRFTTEDFRRMTEVGILPEESGWEIIDGAVNEKTLITVRNAGTIRKLNHIFGKSILGKAIISSRNPIHIDEYNEPEPDIALLVPREDFYVKSHPTPDEVLLLIEVSDSTVEYDRDVKKMLYAEAGIVEFWLVNLKENTVERYSSPKNGSYRLAEILESGETIKAGTIANLEIKIEEIIGS